MVNASGIVENSTFGDNLFSVYLHEANGALVRNNTIGYDLYGLTLDDNMSITIAENTIGLPTDFGKVAIALTNVNHSLIRNNPAMLANTYAIQGIHINDVDIYKNADISVSGVQNTASGGISLTTATECDIWDNYIYASEVAYGIETNNASLNEIHDNYISISSIPNLFRSAAIRNMGSIGEVIMENETYSSDNGNGILAQNSSDGQYVCNLIYDTHDALCIEHNSESQHIETNHKINSHNFDFVTRSRLGNQVNHGNEYWEGSVRAFFDPATADLDLLFSQFLVDENDQYHMPADPIPDDNQWFTDNGYNDEQCDLGDVGPGGQSTFFGDPVRLCDYWDDIKALKDNDPELFIIKVVHIIRYFDIRPWLIMPDCIELDPIFIDLCGLHEIMDIIDRLRTLGDIPSSRSSLRDDANAILLLHDQYSIITDPLQKGAKAEEMKDLLDMARPAFESESQIDEAALQSIKGDLVQIDCTERIVQIMQDAWLKYTDELEYEGLDQNPRVDPDVVAISQECSDEYGDAVHLARSLASVQGSDIYHDAYDGCRDTGYSSPRSSKAVDPDMALFPNPTNGNLNIQFSDRATGTLRIYNSQGMLMRSYRINESLSTKLSIDLYGVYIARFTKSTGETISKKIIVIK